jgi:hypothetical protein
MEVRLVALINLAAELAKLKMLQGLTPRDRRAKPDRPIRRSLSIVSAVISVAALSGCTHPSQPAPDNAAAAVSADMVASRRQLDLSIQLWCTDRKGLPETPAVCGCIADQLHVQSLSDDGARDLVRVLYSVGEGTDPPLERLEGVDRQRLDRAAELCGAHLP